VPVPLALERLASKRRVQTEERFERRAFLERVDAEYASLSLCEIDGQGTTEEVAARVRAAVLPLLQERGVLKA
jgi:thymidylate kinase